MQYNATAHGCSEERGLPLYAGFLHFGQWRRALGVLVQRMRTSSGTEDAIPAGALATVVLSAMVRRFLYSIVFHTAVLLMSFISPIFSVENLVRTSQKEVETLNIGRV